MSSLVYVKSISGDIIPFEIPSSLKGLYKVANLCSEYADYLENVDNQDIDLGRIVFFNENLEKVNIQDFVVNGHTYRVLINDIVVRLSFDRTIRLLHDYQQLPRETHLEINSLSYDAYRYMYNEIECLVTEELGDDYTIYYHYSEDDRLDKIRSVLEKYNLVPFSDDFDFRTLEEEEVKINIIKAYLNECLRLNMNIESYNFC